MKYPSGNNDVSTFVSNSPGETIALGRTLGGKTDSGTLICLYGELGSGKTTLVKGIAEGLGITEKITSPSYLLMKKYGDELSLFHIDLFRINSPDEAIEVGIDDHLIDPEGVVAVEWAERIKKILPEDRIDVRLQFEGEKRKIKIGTPFES